VEVVRALVELGGVEQLHNVSEYNRMPMHLAAECNSNVEVVRLLVELGGEEQLRVTDQYGDLPIHRAAQFNVSVEVVRALVELGGFEQLQETDEYGRMPFHLAAGYNSNVEVVRMLLALGGVEQLQATDKDGRLPMHYAAEANPSVEVVRYLLGKGCDRSLRTHSGNTPLQLAVHHNDEAQVAVALVDAGAETAGVHLSASLQRAAANASVASVLSSYFADNVTPLMAAVRMPPSLDSARGLPCVCKKHS
jgi:ankyrin repeat protein